VVWAVLICALMGLGGPRPARDALLVPDLHPGVPGLDQQHEVVWGGDPMLGGGGLLLRWSWSPGAGVPADRRFG
jgi:hypothetical protein